jgi:ABC-type dipeptide/oligopeptide/nickel transport system permease subunit
MTINNALTGHWFGIIIYSTNLSLCMTIISALTGYWFGIFSGYSGQQFFNDAIYQLYNVVFTALPIL